MRDQGNVNLTRNLVHAMRRVLLPPGQIGLPHPHPLPLIIISSISLSPLSSIVLTHTLLKL